MAEPNTLYKLIIIYMLEKVDFPLTNTQISDFFLEKELTDYFTIQQVIHDLLDSELILAQSTHSNTQYLATPVGKETLNYFRDKISLSIQEDVQTYLAENKMVLKNENSIIADYYKTPEQEYATRCQIKERGISRLDVTLTVKTKEQAEGICRNWKKQYNDVYACLMDLLIK